MTPTRVSLPDDPYVFTQDNLRDDHPDAALFDMDDALVENLLKVEYGEGNFVDYRDIGEFRYAEFLDPLNSSERYETEYVTVCCGVEYDFRFTLSAVENNGVSV